MLEIRRATDHDFDAIWPIFHTVVKAGDTYAYPPDTDQAGAYKIWMATPQATYIALWEGEVVGTYYLKPNQPAAGSHVCNAGFMVDPAARGRGIARRMCVHAQDEARQFGFRAMQFNLVVSSNEVAIGLWQSMGFHIAGTLPGAFKHPHEGYVDAFVMYKSLLDATEGAFA